MQPGMIMAGWTATKGYYRIEIVGVSAGEPIIVTGKVLEILPPFGHRAPNKALTNPEAYKPGDIAEFEIDYVRTLEEHNMNASFNDGMW